MGLSCVIQKKNLLQNIFAYRIESTKFIKFLYKLNNT
jgi:hypothetical protein